MIQLRLRSEYSFGQTYSPIPRIIERLKALGVTAAGLVDNNSTWGHAAWHAACKAANIQPLLGVELVVTDSEEEGMQRMWFLCKNIAGLSELYRANSEAYHQKVATKAGSTPRLYRNDVLRMSENIIKFAGDHADEKFLKACGAIIDLSPASRILNAQKRDIAKRLGVVPVEVCDNAFAFPEDRAVFEFCSKAGLKQTDQSIFAIQCIPAHKLIADECADLALPKAPMVRAPGSLETICREGIKQRGMKWPKAYEQRLQYELELIRSKDFESYFLIVADMVQYAKQHMLVGPSRGSAAGSLVCYCARITEVDPIEHNLMFERFIDVSRSDLPDIDLDFSDDKRPMVFDYAAKKYGQACVAHIGTVSQFKPKSALIQVCKALNIPPLATAAVKVAMIERSGADSRANNCLEDTFTTTEPGKEFIRLYPQAGIAAKLEGHANHPGVHAAGLLISNDAITNYAVVDDEGIAHIDKGAAETLGLLKIDVLGLRTLGILEDSGVKVDWYNLPLNDAATFEVFNKQRMCGIFQFEGNALRAISHEINFKSIVEIDAVTALARPGPFGGGVTEKYIKRMNGEKYAAIHPLVEAHMQETYGLPIYQEQTLAIVREIGKFDWKETSVIRKAMSKRMGKEFFDSYWGKFKKGAASQGIDEDTARATWDMINSMGAWQMNKNHTRSYAIISFWTAWLKAHHLLEFAAANLRSAKDEDSAIQLLRELSREGVQYAPFDAAKSQLNWSVQDGKLYGGFLALKGIGEAKAAKLIEARSAKAGLSTKQLEELQQAENAFADIFPFHRKYGKLYEDPAGNGIADKVWDICDIPEGVPHGEERVVLGELIYKNARNENEEVRAKRRGGKPLTGQLDFVDFRLRDDTGTIGGRIGRRDFIRIGKELLETVPVGSHLLVRAKFFNGIRYLFVTKWKRLA